MNRSILKAAILVVVVGALAGCGSMRGSNGSLSTHGGDPLAVQADDLTLGKKNFRAGNYGLAERHYRRAVERSPESAESWLGLAASYDQIGRFDLADRAYESALKLAGPAPAILNNQGYSHILRGDYAKARKLLRRAQNADPENAHIRGNLELLRRKQA